MLQRENCFLSLWERFRARACEDFSHPDISTVLFMLAECVMLVVGLWCLAQGVLE